MIINSQRVHLSIQHTDISSPLDISEYSEIIISLNSPILSYGCYNALLSTNTQIWVSFANCIGVFRGFSEQKR